MLQPKCGHMLESMYMACLFVPAAAVLLKQSACCMLVHFMTGLPICFDMLSITVPGCSIHVFNAGFLQ